MDCEVILGRNSKIAQNCPTYMFKYIIMQMRKVNFEKGCSISCFLQWNCVIGCHVCHDQKVLHGVLFCVQNLQSCLSLFFVFCDFASLNQLIERQIHYTNVKFGTLLL